MTNESHEHLDQAHGAQDIDLVKFDTDFAQAEVEEREFDPIPDGKYQVNVDRVELTRAQTSGSPMLKWTLRVIGSQFEGRILWRNNVIVTSDNIKWLKTDLHVCGLDLDKLSDLPASLDKLLDVKLEVLKRTRGENENVYINRRIEIEDGGNGCDKAAGNTPIPF